MATQPRAGVANRQWAAAIRLTSGARHMFEVGHLVSRSLGPLGGATHASADAPLRHGRPFSTMCNAAILVGVVVALAALTTGNLLFGCLVGAVLCGMAEAHGRCGISHIGMIAPLAGFNRCMWLKCVSPYSFAGVATSCLVGLAIAGLGTLAAFAVPAVVLSILAAVVALAMMLREAGIVRFDPPQCDVQTHKEWVYEFGLTTATGMWGAHIGLALTTVITHGGLYALVLAAFACGRWLLLWPGSSDAPCRLYPCGR